jgi:hypothetical protein
MDVAIQELGCVDAVFDLANANGLAITDALAPGQVLVVPASTAARTDIAAYFASRGQRINTANASAADASVQKAGIFDNTYSDEFN